MQELSHLHCSIRSLKSIIFVSILLQVSIEGSCDTYVKTFQIQSSDDNVMWMTYKEKETENPKVIKTLRMSVTFFII